MSSVNRQVDLTGMLASTQLGLKFDFLSSFVVQKRGTCNVYWSFLCKLFEGVHVTFNDRNCINSEISPL